MTERWAAAAAVILLCIPLSCTARLAMQHGDPDPPQWPKQYSVSRIQHFDISDLKQASILPVGIRLCGMPI